MMQQIDNNHDHVENTTVKTLHTNVEMPALQEDTERLERNSGADCKKRELLTQTSHKCANKPPTLLRADQGALTELAETAEGSCFGVKGDCDTEKECFRDLDLPTRDESWVSLVSLDGSVSALPDPSFQQDGCKGATEFLRQTESQGKRVARPHFPVYHCGKAGCTCKCMPCLPCQAVVSCRRHTSACCSRRQLCINRVLRFLALTALAVYLVFAFRHSLGDEPSLRLLGVTLVLLAFWLYGKCSGSKPVRFVKRCCRKLRWFYLQHEAAFSWIAVGAAVTGVLYFLLVEVALQRPQALMSAVGVLVYVIIFYVTSRDPVQVNWVTVGWCLALQFGISLLVVRTEAGKATLDWVGDRFQDYVAYTDYGAEFVFGVNFKDHLFAFKVIPSIIFFNATMSVLYYLGVVQAVVGVTSRVVTFTLGTGSWESLHAALSVFMGWAETLVVVRPVLPEMTMAELNTVMTNSYATVSGSTAAAYIQYGVPANQLIAASFMAAPASLALSKLSWPDDPVEKKKTMHRKFPEQPKETGFIEALVSGATTSIILISYVVASVIAVMCLLAFMNDVIFWLAQRVGWDMDLDSMKVFCTNLFWPFVFLMGVPAHECGIVGRLVGFKIVMNEMIALGDLGTVHKNRALLQNHTDHNGTFAWTLSGDITLLGTNSTLIGGVLSERSETIAAFALCGFSDMYAFCLVLAVFMSAAPSRKQDLWEVSMRAWLCGIVAGFLSACMAGLTSID